MDKESLEAPLSLEELHVSLKSLQKGKSPGLDGLPPELYLEIWDLVGILMLNSFNFAIEHGVTGQGAFLALSAVCVVLSFSAARGRCNQR